MEIFLTFPQIINTQQKNNSFNNTNSEAIKCLREERMMIVTAEFRKQGVSLMVFEYPGEKNYSNL